MKSLRSSALALFALTVAQLSQTVLGQSTTYLSNLQTTTGGPATGSNQFFAQPFVTGDNPRGYSVDFVRIGAGTACGLAAGNFQVFFYSDNAGQPGASLGQLFGPNPTTFATYTYDTNGIGLSPGTTYWIVVNATQPKGDCGAAGFYFWQNTSSSAFTATDNWAINTTAKTSTDGGATWGDLPGAIVGHYFEFEINAHVKSHIHVALIAAAPCTDDIRIKLENSGRFVLDPDNDVIDAGATTPTLAQLLQYNSVLVWNSGGTFADPTTLGNNLADYIDAGGGVVLAVFADTDVPPGGRFASDDYFALEPGAAAAGTELTLGTRYDPSSPLLAGVISFDGGTGSIHGTGSPNANASRVADWSNGSPLIVRRAINGVRRVDLGFYPASTDCDSSFWLASTDGAKMIANALDFVAGAGGPQCVPPPPNLQAWWRGDGNGDDSVGGHNGTLLNNVTFGNGEVSKAFQFNGGSEVVSVPNSPAWDFGANDFTIDTWVYLNGDHAGNTFVAHEESLAGKRWIFWTDVDNLEFFINNGVSGNQNINVPFTPPTGQWFHVAVTRSGGKTYKFYVNGAQIGSDVVNSTVIAAADAPLTLGKSASDISLSGLLDEVEIFDRALSPTEINGIYAAGSAGKCECTPPPDNMISWWPAEGDPNDIQDGNNGNISGGVSFAPGKVGQAFNFNGSNGYISVGNPTNLQLTDALTVDAWVRPDTLGANYRTVVSKWSQGGGRSWGLFVAGNVLYGIVENASGYRDAAGGTIPFGTTAEFSHVAMTYSSADGLKLYVNGVQVGATGASIGSLRNGTDSVQIGNDSDFIPDRWFDGLIDEVEIFSTALPAADIAKIYRAGSAGKCRSCIMPPDGMIDWWPADGTADDIVSQRNGALSGGVAFAPGEVSQAFNFDGISGSVDLGTANLLGGATAVTIDAWVFPKAFDDYMGIIYPSSNIWWIQVLPTTGQIRFAIHNGTGGSFSADSTNTIPLNQWSHVAMSWDGATALLYINGVQDPTTLSASGAIPSDAGFSKAIGSRGGIDQFFNGLIDEVEIFNVALGASDIAKIYDAGNGGKCKPPIPAERQLANISARADVETGDGVTIAGFIIHTDPSAVVRRPAGPTKQVLIRGIGPSLPGLGGQELADPVLDLFDANGVKIDHNDNWMKYPDGFDNPTHTAAIQATGLAPSDPKEAALLETLSSDTSYTAILSGAGGNPTGIGLVEVYDLQATSDTHLANLSTRAYVAGGDDVLIAGMIVQGAASNRFLVRALGPSLANAGVPAGELMHDPFLQLFDTNGDLIAQNDNWTPSPDSAAISATNLAPGDNHEAALLFVPTPGNYTAIVYGNGVDKNGIALVEVYRLGP